MHGEGMDYSAWTHESSKSSKYQAHLKSHDYLWAKYTIIGVPFSIRNQV